MRHLINIIEAAQKKGRVVDEVLYHGTNRDFDQFEDGHSNGWSKPRNGFYFTDDLEVVEEFFGNVTEWHVKLNNAANFEHGGGNDIVFRAIEVSPELNEIVEEIHEYYRDDNPSLLAQRFARRGELQTDTFINALKKLGYDGMIFDDVMSQSPFTSYVAFNSNSAKRVK